MGTHRADHEVPRMAPGRPEMGGVSFEVSEHGPVTGVYSAKNASKPTRCRKSTLPTKDYLTYVRFAITTVNRRNEPC